MPIVRRVSLPRCQTAVTPARFLGCLVIDPIQIVQHRCDRRAQTVDVQTAEFDPIRTGAVFVFAPQPFNKFQHLDIAPHPTWKPVECSRGAASRRMVANITVDARRIRPVGFNGDNVEAAILDQVPGYCRSSAVEFAGAVTGLAEKNDSCIAVTGKKITEGFSLLGWRQYFRHIAKRRYDPVVTKYFFLAEQTFHCDSDSHI